MFGYIKPYEDELKVKQIKLYRSLYCGLCRSAGKHISLFSRFFLSYDYTFFAAVRMIFEKTEYTTESARCGFHLFAKKKVISDNGALGLSSAIFSVLTYYKLVDNIKDDGLVKSLFSRLLLPFASHMRKKALKQGFRDVDMIISDCMERTALLEKNGGSVYDLSETFGDMMGYLLKLGLADEAKEDAYTVGFEVGRFIYCADAADDLEKDEKSHSFNPYLNEYGSSDEALTALRKGRNSIARGTDTAADILMRRKSELPASLFDMCEIALNILYLGCPSVLDGILCKDKDCDKCKRH
ncbi:MAG: hypothetical protein IKU43_08390 [Clostridia bacterium]|nr:hypothetical protein [Clostridia bacterium]